MISQKTELSYRRTAAEGATGVGLTIALYDTLAGDLRRAAIAERAGDIHRRTREMNHALTVLGFLESWVDPVNGQELAKGLTIFYSYLRVKMMEGQVKRSPEIIEEQVGLVLQVRGAWQQLELEAQPKEQASDSLPAVLPFPVSVLSDERVRASWSA
jgi:flagellar protein FliS